MNIKSQSTFVNRTELLTSYVKDITRVKPMSAMEEKNAFYKINDSKYRVNSAKKKFDKGSITSKQYLDIQEAEEKIQKKYRDEIIERNQRFVYAVAKRYAFDDLLPDLISTGNIGMLEAFPLYDVNSGNRFCSFAIWYIRRAINAYLVKENLTVRSTNNTRVIPKVKKINNEFYAKHGRKPSDDEIIEILNDKYNIEVTDTSDLYTAHIDYIDASIGDDETNLFENCQAFNEKASVLNEYESTIENEDLSAAIKAALNELSDREKTIVLMSNGIGYDKEYTIQEIAKQIGLTSERVRQLKKGAMIKMRSAYLKMENA